MTTHDDAAEPVSVPIASLEHNDIFELEGEYYTLSRFHDGAYRLCMRITDGLYARLHKRVRVHADKADTDGA